MKKASILVFLTLSVGCGRLTLAQETTQAPESKMKIEDTTPNSNAVPGSEEVDELITNNNLRAYSGSLSKWSIASQFNYNGGTVQTPLSQDRPNISEDSGTTTKADMDGAISVKYNLNAKNSLMAGVGIRWIAPLQKGGPSNYDGTVFDVMNPYVQYQYIYKFAGVQAVLQVQDMQWTQADQTAVGYLQQLSIDQENMYEVGKTGLSIGASTSVQYQWFDKKGAYGSPSNQDTYIADVRSVQSVYELDFAPILEYQINDRFNFRTLVDLLDYEHYASVSNNSTMVHDKVYQEIGLGIKVTRDVFLYPNLQFLPDQISAKLTNVGLSATVNVF